MKKFNHPILILGVVCLLQACTTAAVDSRVIPSTWSIEELSQVPTYEVIVERDGVQGIIYKSVDYQGHAKDVFAYYASPSTLSGVACDDGALPAVVCVQGGGGRAFEQWARNWAERGYAAISMDTRGYGLDRVRLERGFQEGEDQKTPNFVSFEQQSSDWFFQAVSDVVKAHSLIRSMREVDAERTAITGISWGGIITSVVVGLDPRFKAAVPVYGCGYLFDEGSMAPQIAEATELAHGRWHNEYDPSLYLHNAKMPVLFINGTNDGHFYYSQWYKSIAAVENTHQSYRLRMKHGHNAGWEPAEIYTFIGNELGVGDYHALPEFEGVAMNGRVVGGVVTNLNLGDRVSIVYTTASGALDKDTAWQRGKYIEWDAASGAFSADMVEGVTHCYISVQTSHGHYSSLPIKIPTI